MNTATDDQPIQAHADLSETHHGKRIRQLRPCTAIGSSQLFSKKTRVQAGSYRLLVHFLANKDQLLAPVAVACIPIRPLVGPLSFWVAPLVPRHCSPPHTGHIDAAHSASLGSLVCHPVIGAIQKNPSTAACSPITVVGKNAQSLRHRMGAGAIREARNPILRSLGRALPVITVHPAELAARS